MTIDDSWFCEGDAAEAAGDFDAARLLFQRGSTLGDYRCWSRLGLMFDNGVGCEVDKVKAMQCYRRAWRGRDSVAANNIAILYREAGNRRAMFRWFKRAAGAGDDGAFVEIAECLLNGVGVRKNPAEAILSLSRALQGSLSEIEREEALSKLGLLRGRLAKNPSRAMDAPRVF